MMFASDLDFLLASRQEEVLNGPALAPPQGVEPNFENRPNKTHLAYGIFSLCLFISTTLVLIRAYATWAYIKKVSFNDYLMLIAFFTYVSFVCVLFQQAGYVGYFVHQWDYRLRELPRILYLFTVATYIFIVSITFIKGAILFEWLRLFHPLGTRNAFWWIAHIALCINFTFYSAAIIVENLSCIPHERIWDRSIPGACFDSRPLDVTSAAISLFLDLTILILPQRVIWSLQLSMKRKLGVAAVFTVGLIGCVAAAFRLAVTVPYSESQDLTYSFCTVGFWTLAEMTCGVIVFCVPAAPKVAAHLDFSLKFSLSEYWKSLTSLGRTRYRGGSGSSWPRTTDNGTNSSSYHELNDHSNIRQQSLVQKESNAELPQTSKNIGASLEHGSSTILRTTVVTSMLEEGGDMDSSMKIQHPWIEH
ncbi:hypothetical protein F4806DRAFT_472682 [Annulohypoxylon nitens]|nr:hypothetical protein F4806DRAFT_472682 [Annulohypoxylon nitens]